MVADESPEESGGNTLLIDFGVGVGVDRVDLAGT